MRNLTALTLTTAVLLLAACEPLPASVPVNDTYTRTGLATDSTTGPSNLGLDEEALPTCPGQPASGSWLVTTPNLVIEGCRITTKLRVNAPGVVLRGVWVSVGATDLQVQVLANGSGLVIEDGILGPADALTPWPGGRFGEVCSANVGFGGYTLLRTEVYGCVDGGKVSGVVEVSGSFFHDEDVSCSAAGCTHNDTLQKDLATSPMPSLTLTRNTFYRTSCKGNRHLQFEGFTGPSVITIEGNLFYGEHGIWNANVAPGPDVTGSLASNLVAGLPTGGPFSMPPVGTGHLWDGGLGGVSLGTQYFEDGTPVPADGHLATGYTCGAMAA